MFCLYLLYKICSHHCFVLFCFVYNSFTKYVATFVLFCLYLLYKICSHLCFVLFITFTKICSNLCFAFFLFLFLFFFMQITPYKASEATRVRGYSSLLVATAGAEATTRTGRQHTHAHTHTLNPLLPPNMTWSHY